MCPCLFSVGLEHCVSEALRVIDTFWSPFVEWLGAHACLRGCVHVFQVIMSKYPTQNNKKNDLYSFNLTLDVQAQIFRAGFTVEPRRCRDVGPGRRSCDRSAAID